MQTYDWDDLDEEHPDEYPHEEEDASETVECPRCGADVYEDAEQCPACGNYIVFARDYLWKNRPLWWILLGAIGIAAVISTLIAF